MITFYLTGQLTLGNRGCEAIVRSTLAILKQEFGEVKILVPSNDIERDVEQWKNHEMDGVFFTPIYNKFLSRLWGLVLLKFPKIGNKHFPLRIPSKLKKELSLVDAVLSIGGDNYTYECNYPVWITMMDHYAHKLNKPTFLWSASVGPFSKNPHVRDHMSVHLSKFSKIMVREGNSFEYLTKDLQLNNVVQTSDPAFHLKMMEVQLESFWPLPAKSGVLGFNISSLINKIKENRLDVISECVDFLTYCVKEKDFSIVLIPHVTPLDGSENNSDYFFMEELYKRLEIKLSNRISLCPDGYNAEQTKYIISKCRFLYAARTHATIASISLNIPTISIAYSQKAIGLNKDIFGHEDFVMGLDDLHMDAFKDKLSSLILNEEEVANYLAHRVPELKEAVSRSTNNMKKQLKVKLGKY